MIPEYKQAWPDVEVQYLIISTDDYIVCLDNLLDVDWKTSKKYDETGHIDESRFNKILNEVALLESKPHHHLDQETKKNFRRMLGEAVARGLAHDYDSADFIVRQSSDFLVDRSREKSREWYLLGGGISVAFMFIMIFCLLLCKEYLKEYLGINEMFLLISMLGGTIGAFISITSRLGHSNIEAVSSQFLHTLEALAKIMTGAIGGLLSGILVKLGIIMPAFNEASYFFLVLFAVGFMAGASERFIPSFISNIEKQGGINE